MRSRTGCQTCRARKLKCDENFKPNCGQCSKASRQCIPSAGVVFRHQQNASMNAREEGEGREGSAIPKLGAFYSYKNTFNEHDIWVEVPKQVTFVYVTDPFSAEHSPPPESITSSSANGQQLEDTVTEYSILHVEGRSQEHSSPVWHSLGERLPVGLDILSTTAVNDQYFSNSCHTSSTPVDGRNTASPAASLSSANTLNFILNHSASCVSPLAESSLTPKVHHRSNSTLSHFTNDRNSTEVVSELGTAFLLRQFAENTGEWMDLFDLGAYFAQTVPIEAVQNPLLRYAVCANAAKQIARIQGKGNGVKQTRMANFLNADKTDWMYQATQYYDLAISLLMKELRLHDEQGVVNSKRDATTENANQVGISQSGSRSDQTLAATAILCVYEFLDNTSEGWSRHLSGTKSLFDLANKEELMPLELQSLSTPVPNSFTVSQRPKPSKGRKATFWNFARQDFLAAFINEAPTRLDTADLGMWRAAGLLLDDQGFVIPNDSQENASNEPFASRGMQEDMISNALIWLLSKIVNYTVDGDSIDHVFPQDRSSPAGLIGINQMTLLERWLELEKELDIWYKGLPKTFLPYARLEHESDAAYSQLQEIWYGMPMCAATMQSYHMARAILLVNRPQESTVRRTTLSERLHSYRTIESQVRYHSMEILGIALGRPPDTVKVHMVQPLFVAGQCLTGDFERRTIITQLRIIEEDLGWATEYRVTQLLKAWGWDNADTSQT